jgi:hypothetical protein
VLSPSGGTASGGTAEAPQVDAASGEIAAIEERDWRAGGLGAAPAPGNVLLGEPLDEIECRLGHLAPAVVDR